MLYYIYHGIYFFKWIIIWGGPGDLGGQSHIYSGCLVFPTLYKYGKTEHPKTKDGQGLHI